MHEGHRTQCRLARITKVSKPCPAITEGHRVLHRQLHKKIVWMLVIDQRLALVGFTSLKQQWRAAGREGKWLCAKHAAQLQSASAEFVERHRHKPVCGFEFCYAATPALCIYTDNCVVVKHQEPIAGDLIHHVRWRGVRLPRSAGAHLA